jgi:hypothetical protein
LASSAKAIKQELSAVNKKGPAASGLAGKGKTARLKKEACSNHQHHKTPPDNIHHRPLCMHASHQVSVQTLRMLAAIASAAPVGATTIRTATLLAAG